MGIFDKLFGGEPKPQEMNADEKPQAEMEVVQPTPQPKDGEYDSGVKFEDLDENYNTLESLDRDIENLGKEEKDAA